MLWCHRKYIFRLRIGPELENGYTSPDAVALSQPYRINFYLENDMNTASDGADIILYHGRNSAYGALSNGDTTGEIDFAGADSTG